MDIRIMTFNIQHCAVHRIRLTEGREVIDPTVMTDVIRETGADLCGLNEVRGQGEKYAVYTAQAEKMAAILGWHGVFGPSIYVAGTEPYGNGLVSRFPLRKMEVIPIPDPSPKREGGCYESRSILRCEFDIGGGFAVYQSHFGLEPDERANAVSLAHELLMSETLPAVLMGDFNMPPSDPLLAPLHRDLVSTDPLLPDTLTYPSDKPVSKIDYIFANRLVTVRQCGVLDRIASDHLPVWADITF